MKKYIVVSVIALSIIGWSAPALCQATSLSDLEIAEARPLWMLAQKVQEHWGKAVSFEEPMFVHPDEFKFLGNDARFIIRQIHRFDTSEIQAFWHAKKLESPLLTSVIQAYNKQNLGARFRVEESDLGFDIVPTEVRDEQGNYVRVTPVLDTLISANCNANSIRYSQCDLRGADRVWRNHGCPPGSSTSILSVYSSAMDQTQ